MHNVKKIAYINIQQRVCANKATCQLFCSSLLFSFCKLNHFLEISVQDPRKILQVPRNSILETWFSNLENRTRNFSLETRFLILENLEDRESRIENRVETFNLHLSGTVDFVTFTACIKSTFTGSLKGTVCFEQVQRYMCIKAKKIFGGWAHLNRTLNPRKLYFCHMASSVNVLQI